MASVSDHKKCDASAAAMVPNAQQEPQLSWSLTEVVNWRRSQVVESILPLAPLARGLDLGASKPLLTRGDLA